MKTILLNAYFLNNLLVFNCFRIVLNVIHASLLVLSKEREFELRSKSSLTVRLIDHTAVHLDGSFGLQQ